MNMIAQRIADVKREQEQDVDRQELGSWPDEDNTKWWSEQDRSGGFAFQKLTPWEIAHHCATVSAFDYWQAFLFGADSKVYV